jgi:hypothetical protein
MGISVKNDWLAQSREARRGRRNQKTALRPAARPRARSAEQPGLRRRDEARVWSPASNRAS